MKHSAAYSTVLVAAVIAGAIAIPIDVNEVDGGLYSRSGSHERSETSGTPKAVSSLPVDNNLPSTDSTHGTTLPNAQMLYSRAPDSLLEANYDLRREKQEKKSAEKYKIKAEAYQKSAAVGTSTTTTTIPSDGQVSQRGLNPTANGNSVYRRDFDDENVLQARVLQHVKAFAGAVLDTVKAKIVAHSPQTPSNVAAPQADMSASSDPFATSTSTRDLAEDDQLIARNFEGEYLQVEARSFNEEMDRLYERGFSDQPRKKRSRMSWNEY